MNILVNENSKLLRSYCILSYILGGMLLLWGGVMLFRLLCISAIMTTNPVVVAVATENLHGSMTRFIIPGMIALWIGQFIKYVTKQDSRSSWILRSGPKILYLFIFFIILNFVIGICLYILVYVGKITFPEDLTIIPIAGSSFVVWAELIFPKLLYTVVGIFILFGLAQILKHILPVIEEHKSLV